MCWAFASVMFVVELVLGVLHGCFRVVMVLASMTLVVVVVGLMIVVEDVDLAQLGDYTHAHPHARIDLCPVAVVNLFLPVLVVVGVCFENVVAGLRVVVRVLVVVVLQFRVEIFGVRMAIRVPSVVGRVFEHAMANYVHVVVDVAVVVIAGLVGVVVVC